MVGRMLLGGVPRAAHWFQSHVQVRAAENALLTLSIGGFYFLALIGLFDAEGNGPAAYVLETIPLPVTIGLTLVFPFAYILVEWIAALDELRRQPGFDQWDLDQRLYVWLEIGSEVRDRATVVYLPFAPIAGFWAIVLLVNGSLLVLGATLVLVVDLALLFAINRFTRRRNADRLPPGTMLGT